MNNLIRRLNKLKDDSYTGTVTLAFHKGCVSKKIKLEVEDFLVMDYFPTRMAPITDGWVGRTFVKPVLDADKHYIDRLNLSPKTNSVVCIFSGKIDDREVLSAYSSPYKMSPLAVMVRNDPNFHKAVAECISGLTVETKARWQS